MIGVTAVIIFIEFFIKFLVKVSDIVLQSLDLALEECDLLAMVGKRNPSIWFGRRTGDELALTGDAREFEYLKVAHII